VDDEVIPPDLASRTCIWFRDDDDFEEAVQTLVTALDTDLEWVRAHTRLLQRAKEWEDERRDRSFLLRGKDLKDAEALQAQEAEKKEKLTPLQQDYIQASRRATTRFRRLVLVTAAVFLIVAVLGLFGWWQRNVALTRELAGEAQLMSDQGGESLQPSVLLAAEAKNNLIGGASVEADEVMRDGIALLAQPVARLPHEARVNAVDYSPDGKYVATASDDATTKLWDANSGGVVAKLELDIGLSSVVFSPNGKYLATASADGDARVWEVPSGEEIRSFPHDAVVPGSGQPRLAFSPDNKLLATTDGVEKTAYVWDIASGKRVKRLELAGPGSLVAFAPGGKRLATASAATESSGNVAQVWNLDEKREVSRVKHDDFISGVTFSPDGKYLATSSNDRTARVWQIATGEEVSRVEHDEIVTALAFSPDGNRLATVSYDHTARVWDVQSGEEVARFEHDGTLSGLDFSPDGERLATTSGEIARVQPWQPEGLMQEACGRLTRNLSNGEWRQYVGGSYHKTCPELPVPEG
jgi:WD40 repeat protein